MNCIDFRRMLHADPACRDPDFLAHQQSCGECAEAVARAAHLEQRLKQAVQVDVPENLASRILLRQAFAAPRRRRWWRSTRVQALAAGMLLAVGVGMAFLTAQMEERRLAREFVALVNAAPYALAAEGPVENEAIAAALRPVGLGVEGSLGDVKFASRCIVRGILSGHLVLRGETAPVTVFLVPNELVTERADIRSDLYSGIVVPTEGGTIAIVSTPGETLEGIEDRVRAAVRWRV